MRRKARKLTKPVLAGIEEMDKSGSTDLEIRRKFDISLPTLKKARDIISGAYEEAEQKKKLAEENTKESLIKKAKRAISTALDDGENKQQAGRLGLTYLEKAGILTGGTPQVNINLNFKQMLANIPPDWENEFISIDERKRVMGELQAERKLLQEAGE